MSEKVRADVALVQRGLCDSREKAQAQIMAGNVFVGTRKIMKASEPIKPEDDLQLKDQGTSFVSRGGKKLEKALQVFSGSVKKAVAMDIGAATGGFTDVLLRNGAELVYAIDVGYGQLDWGLRNHPKVRVMERTNARYLTVNDFEKRPTVTVMDVSFISIKLILPVAAQIMGEDGCFYTLIKPQFEAGRDRVGKKGVVRDASVHCDVIREIVDFVPTFGWQVVELNYSPITGPEGNIEFLAHIVPAQPDLPVVNDLRIREVVEAAHQNFKK